jgi:HK97 family phage major capsid protein
LSVLTESEAIRRAQLEIKSEAGTLNSADRWDLKLLSASTVPAASSMTLGVRAATGRSFKALASKSTSPNIPLIEDVRLTGLRHDEFKALITGSSDTSGGAFITNMRGAAVQQPRRRLSVLDLALVGDTTSDAVTYARQSVFTNTAAAVPEATSVTTGTKPEAAIAFSVETALVEDYAAYIPITRRSLSDVGELRQAIDSQLEYAVRRKLEEVIVAAMVSGAGSTQPKGADSLFVATLKLLTSLRNLDVTPSAVLLAPVDYEASER